MRRILLALLLVTLFTAPADAFWWRWRRARTRYSKPAVSVNINVGSAQQIAQQKANIQARRGGRCFHPGGSFGGCRYEGVGSGSTPQQALNNCCYTGQKRLVASATAQASNGRYYACKLFQ